MSLEPWLNLLHGAKEAPLTRHKHKAIGARSMEPEATSDLSLATEPGQLGPPLPLG